MGAWDTLRMAQLSPFHAPRGWDVATLENGAGASNRAHPAVPVIWMRWVCGALLVSLLGWLAVASWAAEGDASCAAAQGE